MRIRRETLIASLIVGAIVVGLSPLLEGIGGLWILLYPGFLVAVLFFAQDLHGGGLGFPIVMNTTNFLLYTVLSYGALNLVKPRSPK